MVVHVDFLMGLSVFGAFEVKYSLVDWICHLPYLVFDAIDGINKNQPQFEFENFVLENV